MAFFIAGTDTNVGKTIVAAWLCRHLQMDYWKPIQSGILEGDDSDEVAHLAGCRIYPPAYRFLAPLSPHLAARQEGITIDISHILPPRLQENACPNLIIEGAGGILTPLNAEHTLVDLINHLQRSFPMPVLVVARNQLGTINHTCLTLEALRARSIPIMGVILSGPVNPDHKEAVEYYGSTKVLAELPWLASITRENLQALACPELLIHTLLAHQQHECRHA